MATQVILNEKEFIIRVKNEETGKVFTGEETLNVELINPHQHQKFESNSYQLLKILLESLTQ